MPQLQAATKPTKVVLHVGTNDLRDKTAQEVGDEMVDLAQHIEDKYTDTNVSFSELTVRQDSEDLATKVSQVNKIMARYCSQSDRTVIKNNNIDATCLNLSKLHLNAKGVAILASNLTNFVINNH